MTEDVLQKLFEHPLTTSIFAFMMKKGEPVGVREVQNHLNIPSSATAYWHLNKLKDNDVLVQLPDRRYSISEEYNSLREIPVSLAINHYMVFGMLVPKFLTVFIFSILMVIAIIVSLVLQEWIVSAFMGLLSIVVINILLAIYFRPILAGQQNEISRQ